MLLLTSLPLIHGRLLRILSTLNISSLAAVAAAAVARHTLRANMKAVPVVVAAVLSQVQFSALKPAIKLLSVSVPAVMVVVSPRLIRQVLPARAQVQPALTRPLRLMMLIL